MSHFTLNFKQNVLNAVASSLRKHISKKYTNSKYRIKHNETIINLRKVLYTILDFVRSTNEDLFFIIEVFLQNTPDNSIIELHSNYSIIEPHPDYSRTELHYNRLQYNRTTQ